MVGLPSSGVHSNGFSLVRKIISNHDLDLKSTFGNSTLGETLLTPTRIYAKKVEAVMAQVKVAGIAHITGGGFHENLPRCLAPGLGMSLDSKAYQVPEIFHYLSQVGQVDWEEMYHVFNMGVGLALLRDRKSVV